MINKYIYILIIIFFIPKFIQAIEVDEFTIGFEPLVMYGIDDNYLHMANSIPEMLYHGLQNAAEHIYSESEINILKNNYIESIRKEHLLKLSELIEEYNKYWFSRNYNKDDYISLAEKVKQEQQQLDNLEYGNIPVQKSSVPIHFCIDKTTLNIFKTEKSELSDLIIKGSMEKLDEWIYLQILIKNNILGTETTIYESVSSPDTIPEIIPEIINKLKTAVIGRPWASLTFELVPKDSNISVMMDNEQIPYRSLQFLYPGVYHIEIKNLGYISRIFKIELKQFETRILPVSLEEEKNITISVQSFPSGADLYFGASWVGKTPVLIENPIAPALLILKLEGYNDRKIVYKDNKRDIQIFMRPDIINVEKNISSKRDEFYKSFGYFMLSIPISMVSYGISSDYAYAYDREVNKSPETDRLMRLSNSWYNVYIVGMFLNFTLFVNTIFDLVDYIKSNDRL